MHRIQVVVRPVEILKTRPELLTFPEVRKIGKEILTAHRQAHLSKIIGLGGLIAGVFLTTELAPLIPTVVPELLVSGISVGAFGAAAGLSAFAMAPLVLGYQNATRLRRQARQKTEQLRADLEKRHQWFNTENHIRRNVEANVAKSMVARFARALAQNQEFQKLSAHTVNAFGNARSVNNILANPVLLPEGEAARRQDRRAGQLTLATGVLGRTVRKVVETYGQA